MKSNKQELPEEEHTDEELNQEVKKIVGAAQVLDLIHSLFVNTNRNRRLNHLPSLNWDDFFDEKMKELFE
jgi:hypothetical protein